MGTVQDILRVGLNADLVCWPLHCNFRGICHQLYWPRGGRSLGGHLLSQQGFAHEALPATKCLANGHGTVIRATALGAAQRRPLSRSKGKTKYIYHIPY